MEDHAVCAVARHNATRCRLQCRALAIQPHTAALLHRTVTAYAVLLQQRTHILRKVDLRWSLCRSEAAPHTHTERQKGIDESSHPGHPMGRDFWSARFARIVPPVLAVSQALLLQLNTTNISRE